jgi:hypothetical protein
MAQLANMKVHSLRGRHALKLLDIDGHSNLLSSLDGAQNEQ